MILLITGMHRSGTSALASIIDELGIMPLLKNDMAADVINPAGYFESTKVCSVNDKVLGESLDTWDSASTGLRQGLIESNSTIASRVSMIKTLVSESGISPQALPTKFSYIKDPRFCLTYPEWDRALNQVSPIVLSVRNPMTVSQSLWIRNGFTKIHSLALWWSYYRSALTAASQNRSLLMVGFENLCESPVEEITRISDWLSTNFKYLTPKSNLKIAHKKLNLAFIRATKHERGSSWIQQTAHEKEVLDFYHSLLNSDIQGIRSEFLGTAPSWVSEVLETYGSVSHSLSFSRKSLLASQATNFEISKQLDELAKRNQDLEVWLRDTESARATAIAENFGLNEKLNSVAKQNQDLEVGRQNDLNEQLALTESINQLESETNLLAERLSTTLQRNSNLETGISETESARALALAEVQLLTERTNQLESETNLLAERLSTTLQRNSNLETWISETESARVIADQQVKDLQLTCANLERNLQSSNQAFHDLAAHQATLLTSERALKAIVKSNSWRATEPLRKLGEIARKLHHYFSGLRASRKNSNSALEIMNVLPLKPISEVRVAVVVHVYYSELLEELLNYLKEISESFCLILTGPRESRVLKILDKNIRSNNWKFDQKSVKILLVENRGRDIGPFCSAINEFGLDSVPFILKLHTKASPHRTDGEIWRRHLVSSLCSSKQRVTRIISALGSTTGPSMVIPNGQIGTHSEAGANFNQMKLLLSRVGINYSILELKELKFGMGSMFWCRGQTLEPIRRLALSSFEFDEEAGQLDGTLAHAIERILGVLATRSGSPLVTADEVKQIYPRVPTPTFYSFFLPQFHNDSNNDEWWGEGFNEWQLLDRTEPLFPGHQILTPANGTKYDLSNSQEVLIQLDKAKQLGLSGLLMYHYVFGSRNVLRRPFEVMLKQTELPLPIALTWANENWTRKWDGQDSEILVSQEYTESVINQLSDDFISLIKAGHALMTPLPTLVVYRPLAQLLELSLLDKIREKVWQAVNSEISIGGVCSSYSCADWPVIKQRGFDFAIEFPPHSSARPTSVSIALQPQIYDFNRLVSDSLDSTISDSKIWRGAMPGWDNSPRRGASSHLFSGSNPLDFRRWILGLAVTSSSPIVINALNEWGEGAVLESTAQFGDSFQNVIGEFSLMNQKNSTC